jgi:hypothetical protein
MSELGDAGPAEAMVEGVEKCEIVWWQGYVKGRFQAYAETGAFVAESPLVRWRGDAPDPTEEARAALDALTERLVAEGWTADGAAEGGTWFALVFSRPVAIPVQSEDPAEARPDVAEAPPQPAAVARLRTELTNALDEVERQRRLRAAAEREAVAVAAAPAAAAPRELAPRRPLGLLLGVPAVVAAAVLFFVVADSVYAALVAALTASAVCLGLDSFLAVRSQSRRTPA